MTNVTCDRRGPPPQQRWPQAAGERGGERVRERRRAERGHHAAKFVEAGRDVARDTTAFGPDLALLQKMSRILRSKAATSRRGVKIP